MRALVVLCVLASSAVASAETLAARVAAVLGDKGLPRVPVGKAAARWAPLVELKDRGNTQAGRELAGSNAEVRWADVLFEPTGKTRFWIAQLGLMPDGGDLGRLHAELVAALGAKLGKPRRYDGASTWRLGGGWVLFLYPAKKAANPLSPKQEEEQVVYLELSAENND